MTITRLTPYIAHRSTNLTLALAATIKRTTQQYSQATKHVQFHTHEQLRFFHQDDIPMVTYDSGADGHSSVRPTATQPASRY